MKTITETRMLPYIFTADEHLQNAAEMARLADQVSELASTHKQIKSSLKEELETLNASLQRMVRFVRDKRDFRKTECRWIMDCPAVGQKTLRRNDTDIDVEVRRMEEHEKQESLNLQPVTEELPFKKCDKIIRDGEPWRCSDREGHEGGCVCEDGYTGPVTEPSPAAAPPAMPETAKAEAGRKSRFGPQKVD